MNLIYIWFFCFFWDCKNSKRHISYWSVLFRLGTLSNAPRNWSQMLLQSDLCWTLTPPWGHRCSMSVAIMRGWGASGEPLHHRNKRMTVAVAGGARRFQTSSVSDGQTRPLETRSRPLSPRQPGLLLVLTVCRPCRVIFTHRRLYLKVRCYSLCWPRLNALWDILVVPCPQD